MSRVAALAGRRIDAGDAAPARFPLASVPLVRERLRSLFLKREISALVCSAACGADLTALEVAEQLAIRRHIVLPFEVDRFRETSVTDRPGDWGDIYDRMTKKAREAGTLTLLEKVGTGSRAYAAANMRIIEEALTLAGNPPPSRATLAVIVWDGHSRGGDDATQQFADLAEEHRFEVAEILTV